MYLAFSITGVFQGVIDVLGSLLNLILLVFPKSPFVVLSEYTLKSELLQYLNYLLPIAEMVVITEAWLAAITIFYIWSVIAKWVKLCS